jgi:predicted lipid-binding transport protein (Tim44 family)
MAGLFTGSAVIAAAGGGSAGFHGGGGGGGHGGKIWILLWLIAHPVVLAFVVAIVLCLHLYNQAKKARRSAHRSVRANRVEVAAAEAADDDAAFSPDVVKEQATRLFEEIQAAWDAGDRQRLRDRVGRNLMVEWDRRLDDFERRGLRNRVSVLSGPEIKYVSMTNRADDRDDRVVVHVKATIKDVVVDSHGSTTNHGGSPTPRRRLGEYWTLGKRDGRWTLLSIEQEAEGHHNVESKLVVTPWDDTANIRDEALLEGAAADKLPEHAGVSAGELVSVGYENDARAAALDLSLVDGRFAPDVLEVAVRRVVAAWAEAVDGSDAKLQALGTPWAVNELLHRGDLSERTRLVVRGPRVRRVTIESLDANAEPPRMTVAVEADAFRYVEDRDTTRVISGDPDNRTRFTAHWALTLDGDDANPWRIANASAPRVAT